jgi:hypothetical protein
MGTSADAPCFCVVDAPPTDRAEWHPADSALVEIVKEHGWGVTVVPETDDSPPFAYTTGLWHSHRVPEVSVFGLAQEDAHGVLNAAGQQLRDGWRPQDGHRSTGFLMDREIEIRVVRQEWYAAFFGRALWFAQAPPLPFLQLVWPDLEDRFPGDDDCDELVKARQPLLWMPPVSGTDATDRHS